MPAKKKVAKKKVTKKKVAKKKVAKKKSLHWPLKIRSIYSTKTVKLLWLPAIRQQPMPLRIYEPTIKSLLLA